jgi:hypothetical protein
MTTKTLTKAPVEPTKISIGKTSYFPVKSVLRFGKHADGNVAIQGYDPRTGNKTFLATLSMGGKPVEGYVWLKGWDENEGVIDALVKAGVVSITGKAAICGKYAAIEARLLV